MACCQLCLKLVLGLVCEYRYNYQWVAFTLCLKIKIGLVRENPFILQQVTSMMCLKTNMGLVCVFIMEIPGFCYWCDLKLGKPDIGLRQPV